MCLNNLMAKVFFLGGEENSILKFNSTFSLMGSSGLRSLWEMYIVRYHSTQQKSYVRDQFKAALVRAV